MVYSTGHEVIAALCELRSPESHKGVRIEFERTYLPDLQDRTLPGIWEKSDFK